MTRSPLSLRARCKLVAAGILIAGLAAALAIYLTATPSPENPLGYQLEDSKPYLRQLELYGGKANVLATKLRQWFDGLWHGRALAFTVASLSILLSFAVFIYATLLPRAVDPTEPLQRNRNAPDSASPYPPSNPSARRP